MRVLKKFFVFLLLDVSVTFFSYSVLGFSAREVSIVGYSFTAGWCCYAISTLI